MAKITRVTQQPFGLNGSASHFGAFGSRAAGSPFNTKDPAAIQALTAWTNNGWLDAINSGNKAPFLEDMNGAMFVMFYQLMSLFQDGISVWDPGTTYYTGSVVRRDGTFEQYGSLVDNNLNNVPPSKASNGFWQYLNPATVAPGIMQDFAGTTPPFGYLLCDGGVYPQASFPDLFSAIGSTWNTFNGNASPGVGNFRVPDLRGLTTMGTGQGNGFSNRTLAQLVGEETHVLTIAEMPSHNHPGTYAVDVGLTSGSRYGIAGLNSINQLQNTTGYLTPGSIQNNGGGGAHNNMQPTVAVTKIIKY